MEDKSSNNESRKNISDKWLDAIMNNLERLEYYERALKNGHQDLFEYLNNLRYKNIKVATASGRIEAMSLMISEFELTFSNIGPIVNSKKIEEFEKKLEEINNYYTERKKYKDVKVFKYIKDANYNIINIKISEVFEFLVIQLSKMRRDLINELKHLLFATDTAINNELREDV